MEAAHALYKDALKQSATDPTTGRVDVNILAAGMSATTRKQVRWGTVGWGYCSFEGPVNTVGGIR